MSQSVAKAGVPEPRRKMIELMQRVNFGRIERLAIRHGNPVLDPHPTVVREHKFGGGENGPRPELGAADFLLKQQVIELFALFGQLKNGVIDVLEIKHGLPFRVTVTEVPA